MADYYRVPFVSPRCRLDAFECLALDIETTGLHPAHDQILSIGYTRVADGCLQLAPRRHDLVRPSIAVPETSAVTHGILDDRAATGIGLRDALDPLLEALAGRVLLAHHAAIEHGFLDRACRRMFGCPFVVPVIDTLALERRALSRANRVASPGSLRLAALRTRYGLPRYRAHDALGDAIGVGELLLAQLAHRSDADTLRLADLAWRP